MAIVAILTGGLFGSLTALIALFGVGVDWSTGFAIYFATATLFSMPILGMGMYSRTHAPMRTSLSDWERELHGNQPDPMFSNDNRSEDRNSQDRSAA